MATIGCDINGRTIIMKMLVASNTGDNRNE